MVEYIDSIIEYLNSKFSQETQLSKKPVGERDSDFWQMPTVEESKFAVRILDNSTESETFLREVSSTISLQISVYGLKAKINNVLVNAQVYAEKLANLIIRYMEEYKYASTNIIRMRRVLCTPALPFKEGSKIYVSTLRYEIIKEN